MSLPILKTKLYAPRRQRHKKVIHRPRLTEQLAAGLAGKVTLISAPAGFGKSTLLSEWIARLGLQSEDSAASASAIRHHIAWLTLDSDDNDPVRFLMYLIASLQEFDADVGTTAWPLLQAPGGLPSAPAPKTILALLINDLILLVDEEKSAQARYTLVLEDYHVIAAQPIHDMLTYLIEHAPPHVHVIMTTRADPPLPFARWRASDQLAEIRAGDLRFTADEAAAFLNDCMSLHLSPAEVAALELRTEGWIAGLQLVAISLQGRANQGRANRGDFVQRFSGSHRYVLTYLVEEVLNQQSPTVQQFLLHTSILDRLCGPLCAAVLATGPSAPNAHRTLEQLEQANLFLAPLDDEGQWYRYHPLFADVLQHRLGQTQPEVLPLLHSRASVWYEQHGLVADAIQHAVRAAEYDRAAQLVEQSWPVAWNQGTVATLINWVQALPRQALLAHPNLAISYAWALALGGQMEAAATGLDQVEVLLQANDPVAASTSLARKTLLGRIAALRAMMAARRGEALPAVQLAQNALDLIPDNNTLLRGNAYYALGLAYQQNGALAQALQAYQAATRLGMAVDDHFLTVVAQYHEARIWLAQGQLSVAANIYQQLLTPAAASARPLPLIGLAYVGHAEILYQWNDLAAAAEQVENGMALSPSGSLTYTDGPFQRFLTLARIRQARGDQAGALEAVQAARETAQQTGIALDAARAAALATLIYLRLGQMSAADQWAQAYLKLQSDEECLRYVHEFETLVYLRVLLAQGRADEVLALSARWLPSVEAATRTGGMIELLMLRAQALAQSSQAAAARNALLQVLGQAEPAGYVRLFVDEGEPMRLLLDKLRLTTVEPTLQAYIEKLLAAFDSPPPALAPSKDVSLQAESPSLIEPLTSRELEVLYLLAAGLSNAAIAAQMVVSVGTVKSHLKHIYGKLAVQSRMQAVAQARVIGLL